MTSTTAPTVEDDRPDGPAAGALSARDVLAELTALATEEPPEWQQRALCAQTAPRRSSPSRAARPGRPSRSATAAKSAPTASRPLGHDERFGIWGGLSERERRRLKRDHGSAVARPPAEVKVPEQTRRESAPAPGNGRHAGGRGLATTLPTEPRHPRGRPAAARASTFPDRGRLRPAGPEPSTHPARPAPPGGPGWAGCRSPRSGPSSSTSTTLTPPTPPSATTSEPTTAAVRARSTDRQRRNHPRCPRETSCARAQLRQSSFLRPGQSFPPRKVKNQPRSVRGVSRNWLIRAEVVPRPSNPGARRPGSTDRYVAQ